MCYLVSYFIESLWINLLALTLLLVPRYFFFEFSICSLAESSVKVLSNLVNELEGVEPERAVGSVGAVDADGEILGHVAGLNRLDDNTLEGLAEVLEGIVAVELGTVEETTSPGEHGSNGVG